MQGSLFKNQERHAIEGIKIENFFHSSTVCLSPHLCVSICYLKYHSLRQGDIQLAVQTITVT